jgi:hypothetical protein
MIAISATPKAAPTVATLHVRKILFAFTHADPKVSAPWVVIQYGKQDKAGKHLGSEQIRVRLTAKVRSILEAGGSIEERVAALVDFLANKGGSP